MGASNNIMELAKRIHKSRELGQSLENISELEGVKQRKAYYLALIWSRYGGRTKEVHRLEKIGWSKLAVIAEHSLPGEEEKYLEFAETATTKELVEMFKHGGNLIAAGVKKKRTVLMRFTVEEYAVFEQALKRHGATTAKQGKGLVNMELAILKMIDASGGSDQTA